MQQEGNDGTQRNVELCTWLLLSSKDIVHKQHMAKTDDIADRGCSQKATMLDTRKIERNGCLFSYTQLV